MQLKHPVDSNDHFQGNPGAQLVIVEYGDYQCPHCGAAHPIIQKIMEDFGSQVKFVFRNFPLSEIHPLALPAALAAEAASRQGKFWEMHDAIFEQQRKLSESMLVGLGEMLGLDAGQFKSDRADESLAARVDNDFETGMRSGVNGTPTFFIDGNKFDGGAEDLYNILRENAG
ncbi:MAG: DsbA family protein [Chitinophagaceae bacterium]|nr:MAG: DsbA family protein [Chitinophagaceae bacterium]